MSGMMIQFNYVINYYYIMMKLITRYVHNCFYMGKSLETTPITKVNMHLLQFMRKNIDKSKFQSYFASYQNYLFKILVDNPQTSDQKIILFDYSTKIYSIYHISSKKLTKLHNKLAEECLQFAKNKGPESIITILLIIQRYNQRKALSVFKTHKDEIIKKMRSFQPQMVLNLLKFLRDSHIDDPIIRQTAIEMLFKQIIYLNQHQITLMVGCLASSKKYINKDFLTLLAKRILILYKSNNFQEYSLYGMLASLAQIEVNLHTRSIYVDDLDDIYEQILPSLFGNINGLSDIHLNRLASALRRSKYYDQPMINQLFEAAMKREIVQFKNSQSSNKSEVLSLRTFINIINTSAVFNFCSTQFKKYAMSILKIIAFNKQLLLPSALFSRLLWSICVIYQRHEVSDLYPLISEYIYRSSQIPLHQAMNFYYCFLYLRTTFPQISQQRDKIQDNLKGFQLETHSSSIQIEVFQNLIALGIPCLSQYNLNNMICDIMIPEYKNLKNVIIELHGFRHFFRNVKKLTGSNILKQKIIRSQMYSYYFISVDEWLITEDKKQFLLDFIDHINTLEINKKDNIPQIAKTSIRVRSRPRTFRISSQ